MAYTAKTFSDVSITLDSAADDCVIQSSADIDNSSNRYRFLDLVLTLSYSTAPASGSIVHCYLYPTMDSKAATYSADLLDEYLVGSFQLDNVTGTQNQMLARILVGEATYKVILHIDGTGQTTDSSGNGLRSAFYD